MTALDQTFPERLVSEGRAAEILGCSVYAMRSWRGRKVGPPYVRVGRLVRYRLSDIQKFIEAGRVEVL